MFVARVKELSILEDAYASDAFQMVVVYGRRRVGKTRLLQEFCATKPRVVYFTARETSANRNLQLLSEALLDAPDPAAGTSPVYPSMDAVLRAAFARGRDERLVLVIDEFPYLAASNPEVPSLLQELVDKNHDSSRLMLILCGSSMSFMEHQVLGHQSPLYGRRTAQIRVEPFDAMDAALMLPGADPVRTVELYSLVGGVPLYLEQLNATRTTEWNICHRMLGQGRFLYAEPENFLLQEVRSPALYNAVTDAVASGCTRANDIASACGMSSSAVASYLSSLAELGVVGRFEPVGPHGRKDVRYHLTDNLFRFWHTFVPRYGTLVDAGMETDAARRIVRRDLSTYVGHTFEVVCRQWVRRQMASGAIDILPRALGSWWGTDPARRERTDVDVVVKGLDGELVVGECKWETAPVGSDVIGVLAGRAKLVDSDATDVRMMLFSKSGFTGECEAEARRRGNVRLVSVGEMFGQPPAITPVHGKG
jgi:AAA+ ATPase superfamily predicted ATPase